MGGGFPGIQSPGINFLSNANGVYTKDADGTRKYTNKKGFSITTHYRIVRRKPGYERTWTHAKEYYAVTHEASGTVFYLVRRYKRVPPVPRHQVPRYRYQPKIGAFPAISRVEYVWVEAKPERWIPCGDTKWVNADGSRLSRTCK